MIASSERTTPIKRCESTSTYDGVTNECTLLEGHFGLHNGGTHAGSEISWSGSRRVSIDASTGDNGRAERG